MGSYTKHVMAFGFLAAVVGHVMPSAQAQETAAPLLLVPGVSQKDVPHGTTQLSQPASPAPILRLPSQPALAQEPVTPPKSSGVFGIDIGGLAAVDPEAVGTLNGVDPTKGTTPWTRDLGANLWFAADRKTAIATIKALPNAPASLAAQGMVRQILLTAAAPKIAGADVPQAEDAKGQVVAARINKLVQIGQPVDALALANILSHDVVTEPVLLAQTLAQWLHGDVQNACAAADRNASQYETPIWPKMQAACGAISGDKDKAQLKLALLNELNLIDAAFQPIADKILGRKRLSLAEVPADMGPFEAAAFKALGGKFPESLPLQEKPWLAKLAIPSKGNVTDGHLALVEFALAHNLMSPSEADAVYQRVKFSKKEKKAVLDLSAKAESPRMRALYWLTLQRTESAESPAAKIEILARLMKAVRQDAAAQQVLSVLLADHLASVSDNELAAWLAGDAVRLALWSGNWAEARKWVDLARKNAGASQDARQALRTIAPLMKVVEAAASPDVRAAGRATRMLESWQAEQAKRGLDAQTVMALRDRLLGVYRVMSLPIHAQDWAKAVANPAKPAAVLAVSPLVSMEMNEAARKGARALVLASVAQQLAILNADPKLPSSPQDINISVQALLQSAAMDWAKRIAVESLLFEGA